MKRLLFALELWLLGCAAASAQMTGPIYCNKTTSVALPAAGSAVTLIPAPATGTSALLLCGYSVFGGSTASALTVSLIYATAANCGGGTPAGTTLIPAFPVPASTIQGDNSPNYRGLEVPPNGGNLCVSAAGTTSAGFAVAYWAQQ
jgi:hypothetical protein